MSDVGAAAVSLLAALFAVLASQYSYVSFKLRAHIYGGHEFTPPKLTTALQRNVSINRCLLQFIKACGILELQFA